MPAKELSQDALNMLRTALETVNCYHPFSRHMAYAYHYYKTKWSHLIRGKHAHFQVVLQCSAAEGLDKRDGILHICTYLQNYFDTAEVVEGLAETKQHRLHLSGSLRENHFPPSSHCCFALVHTTYNASL